MRKPRVLFLCAGSSAHGQMAEAFLRKYAHSVFETHSVKLEPVGIHPLAVKVMDEIGIQISDQEPKGLAAYLGQLQFQYLIAVGDDADQGFSTIWPGMRWSFDDPARFQGTEEEHLTRFREVRDLINTKIKSWITEGMPA